MILRWWRLRGFERRECRVRSDQWEKGGLGRKRGNHESCELDESLFGGGVWEVGAQPSAEGKPLIALILLIGEVWEATMDGSMIG